MKAINALIIALVAALAFSSYLLMSKIMPKSAPGEPASATVASSKQETPAPEPVAMQQPRPQVNIPTPSAPPPQPPVAQTRPVPAPPVKEEPKLRPVRDIKVVMYMTDW